MPPAASPPPGSTWSADGFLISASENARRLRLEALAHCAEAHAHLDSHASDPRPDNWPPEPAQANGPGLTLGETQTSVLSERLEALGDKKAQLGRELDRITQARLRGEPTPEGGPGSVAVQFRRVEVNPNSKLLHPRPSDKAPEPETSADAIEAYLDSLDSAQSSPDLPPTCKTPASEAEPGVKPNRLRRA